MKILIAEDDPTSALLLRKTLESEGYDVVVTTDGVEALEAVRRQEFAAILTDWMMPNMDGISLVRRVRAELESPPPLLVVTALSSNDARNHALEAGADDYLAKPYEPREILRRLSNCIDRARQPAPEKAVAASPGQPDGFTADHVGVAIAASTGGPEALRSVLPSLAPGPEASFFLVLHGPGWMLETFAERAQALTSLDVRIAADRETVETGKVYISPGDVHLQVDGPILRLVNDPPENFVRPAADPLFRSIARTYGRRGVAVVMTGMGRDGSLGAQFVHHAGGRVLVQDPVTAVAASMPRTTVGMGIVDHIHSLDQLGTGIMAQVRESARAEATVGN